MGVCLPPRPQSVRPQAGLGRGAQAPGSPMSPCSPCSALSADTSEISPCRAGAASPELSDPIALPPAPTPCLLRAACAQRSSVGGKNGVCCLTAGTPPRWGRLFASFVAQRWPPASLRPRAAAAPSSSSPRPRASACQLLRGPAVPSLPDCDLCQICCPRALRCHLGHLVRSEAARGAPCAWWCWEPAQRGLPQPCLLRGDSRSPRSVPYPSGGCVCGGGTSSAALRDA